MEGKEISFKAPCACTATEAIQIEGVNYEVCDALGNRVTGVGSTWNKDSIVTVVLSVAGKKAYIQNSANSIRRTGDTVPGNDFKFNNGKARVVSNDKHLQFSNYSEAGNTDSAAHILLAHPAAENVTKENMLRVGRKVGDAEEYYSVLHMGNRDLVVPLYTATVGTTWTASGSYFYQDITVEGILASDNPFVDILPGSDNAKNVQYSQAFGKVFRITTSANKIRVWVTSKPAVAFDIQIRVVR